MSGARRGGGRARQPIPLADILAYLRAGHTQAAAARHFGVSREAIRKRLRGPSHLLPVRQGTATPTPPEAAVPVLEQMNEVLADIEAVLRPLVDQARQGEPLTAQDRAVVIRGAEAKARVVEGRFSLEERLYQVRAMQAFILDLGVALAGCSEPAKRELLACAAERARLRGLHSLFLPGRPFAHLAGHLPAPEPIPPEVGSDPEGDPGSSEDET